MGSTPEQNRSDLKAVMQRTFVNYWPVFLAGLLFLVAQLPALKSWIVVWDEKEGYYSHGYLVPFIAAFMLWTRRSELAKAKISPSWWGCVLLLIFLPIHFVGVVMGLRAVYGLAFFLCVFGLSLAIFGKQVTKAALIPMLFLVTMIPAANTMLDAQTFRAQMVSATVATKALQLTTPYSITQSGMTIYSSSLPSPLVVGSPCSGLRLLVSLITFSWFFTYVIRTAWWKKAILIGLSFPLSVFVNSLRITMIGYVGFWTGSSEAMHSFHDYSGYIGLVVCFAILFGVARLLKTGELYTGGEPSGDGAQAHAERFGPVGAGAHGSVVLILLTLAMGISVFAAPVYNFSKGQLDRSALPMAFGIWQGEDLSIDENTKEILNMGDHLSRGYINLEDADRSVQVFTSAAEDISAFHNPLLCLPGGGNQVMSTQQITLKFTKPKPITVNAELILTDKPKSVLIHWYMLGEKSFPGTAAIQSANRDYKLDDLTRFIKQPWDTNKLRTDVSNRHYTWYRFSTQAYDDGTDREFLEAFIKEFIANVKNFGE